MIAKIVSILFLIGMSQAGYIGTGIGYNGIGYGSLGYSGLGYVGIGGYGRYGGYRGYGGYTGYGVASPFVAAAPVVAAPVIGSPLVTKTVESPITVASYGYNTEANTEYGGYGYGRLGW